MSDLLRLADQLRHSTNDALTDLIARRPVATNAQDFLDLAQVLLQPKSIEAALARLNTQEIAALEQALHKPGSSHELLPELVQLGLAHTDGTLFEAVAKSATDLLSKQNRVGAPVTTSTLSNQEPLASIAAFETVQAITELVLDLEQHRVRVVGKLGVGLPDIKRLAQHLGKPNNDAKFCFEFAIAVNLISADSGVWRLTSLAGKWLELSIDQRWLLLAQNWVATLGSKSAQQLHSLSSASPTPDLTSNLVHIYPLADKALGNQLQTLTAQAEGLGFTVHGFATGLLLHATKSQWNQAVELLNQHLPATQESVIIQADLSLITPGPLPTKAELLLRTFAQIEQVSIASRYRLSALSLSHGLECGLTETEIRNLLSSLSNKPLPQPVDYLITETVARFGRLVITDGPTADARTILKSRDGLLLTEILNDVRLKPFALFPHSAGSLASRFDSQVLYFGLRDLGFVPIRHDANGKVISPRVVQQLGAETVAPNIDVDLISRLRAADERIGTEPDDTDLLRQIHLALKNKSRLRVTVTTRDQAEVEFELLPTSLANGRLRGLDQKADIERTLPIERIVRIGF